MPLLLGGVNSFLSDAAGLLLGFCQDVPDTGQLQVPCQSLRLGLTIEYSDIDNDSSTYHSNVNISTYY